MQLLEKKMALLQKKSTPCELKSGGQRLFVKEFGEDGTFSGYGSVFGVKDSYSEIVAAGAFKSSLAEHRENGTFPALLWQHDPAKPIGVYTEAREDEKGLFVRGKLELDTQLGKEAHALLKAGALNGLSIGFIPIKSSYDEDTKVRTLTEVELWEVSLVTFPANGKARVEGVKNLDRISGLASLKEVERHLRDEGGYSQNAATTMVARMKQLLNDEREARNAKADIMMSSKRLASIMEN